MKIGLLLGSVVLAASVLLNVVLLNAVHVQADEPLQLQLIQGDYGEELQQGEIISTVELPDFSGWGHKEIYQYIGSQTPENAFALVGTGGVGTTQYIQHANLCGYNNEGHYYMYWRDIF